MSDVLVLLDAAGELSTGDRERLTLARDLGGVVAVAPGTLAQEARDGLSRLGVARAVELTVTPGLEPAPEVAHGLVEIMGRREAVAAVLVPPSGLGSEVAARVSVRTGSGLVGHASDVRWLSHGIVASQVVFEGRYRVESSTTTGTPIIQLVEGCCRPREHGPVDVAVTALGATPSAPMPAARVEAAGEDAGAR